MAPPPTTHDPAHVAALLERVRKLCLALPEVEERLSHSAPSFFVRGKKLFANFVDGHHKDGRLCIWCAAPEGAQQAMVDHDPERFFVPPYVGHRGWVAVILEGEPDWGEVAQIVEDAYRCVAPKTLVKQLDAAKAG